MIHVNDLPLLLAAVRDGTLDPDRVGELLAEWDPTVEPRFPLYLVARGALSPADLRRLSAAAPTLDQPTPATVVRQYTPADDDGSAVLAGLLDETPTAVYCGPETPRSDAPPYVGPRYRVVRKHRSGGLGEVWLGVDEQLGREVAVKVLRRDRSRLPGIEPRFLAEAKAAGRLEHPNIVPVYDLLPAADGRQGGYVMRFVSGRTLAEVARDFHSTAGPASFTRAALAPLLDAFVLVCKAVAFAHNKNVLHRDLKGANILVGDYGEVQLLDWGLAKTLADRAGGRLPSVHPEDTDLTVTNGVVGTPAYMAPEVASGQPATPASDVYGLGATLYALLTGRPPADGLTPEAVLEVVKRNAPPPPRAVNPRLPAGLDGIVRKAMSRDIRDRYPSADALAADVRRWLADEPVTAYRDGPTVRAARWVRRHRTAAVAAVLVLLTVTVGLAVGAVALAREEARTARLRAAADKLVVRLVDLAESGLAPMPETEPARRELLDLALDTYQPLLAASPDDPALRATVATLLRHRANQDARVGRTADAGAALREADVLFDRLVAEFPSERRYQTDLALLRTDHSRLLLRDGKVKDAGDLLALGPPVGGWPGAYFTHQRAEVAAADKDWETAARYAEGAANQYRMLANDNNAPAFGYAIVLEARARLLHGHTARQLKQPNDAAERYEAAVTTLDTPAGRPGGKTPLLPTDLNYARAECRIAQARLDLTDPAAADYLDEAVTLSEALVVRHPTVIGYRLLAAEAYRLRGRLGKPDAADDLNRAWELLEKLAVDRDHPPAVAAGRIEVLRIWGKAAEAEAAVRAAAARWPELDWSSP